jgi:two-component system sensor histidine kinase KdpD
VNLTVSTSSRLRNYFLAVLACALTTLLTLPLLGRVDLANIVLLFVLAVVLVATLLGRGPAILASFLAVACFDFFFVPPRFYFTVAHFQYLIIFAVMLAVSLIISHLTNAYREKAIEAERRSAEAAMLRELAENMIGALALDAVVEHLQAIAQRYLHAETALLLSSIPSSDRELTGIGLPINKVEYLIARNVFVSGKPIEASTEPHSGKTITVFPLEGTARRRGVILFRFGLGDAISNNAALLSAIAAVITAAIERIDSVEVAHTTTLEMQSERLRNAILASLSHDLRTPLTVLYGLADSLAQREELAAENRATALHLRDQCFRLTRMVDNLLDLARIRSGRIKLRRDWQSIPEIVGAAVHSLRPWLDSRRLKFSWPESLPLVKFDAVLIERVLCNLLENAVKYSPETSPIVVGASISNDRHWFQIWIDNEGEGFPADRIAQLFNMFERGTSESVVSGVGIGLAVSRAIVEAHGGRIFAMNRVQDGARVMFELPFDTPPELPEESSGS